MDIARSSLKVAAAKVGSLLLTFIGTAFFARELGATSLGAFFLFQAVLKVASLPANLGTRLAVEKRISGGGEAERILGAGVALKTILLLIVTTAILAYQPYLNQYIGFNTAILLIIAIVFQEFAELMMNVLRGELRVGETATLQFIYYFAWVILGAIFILLNFGVFGLIYSLIAGRGIQILWAIYKTSVGINRPTRLEIHSLIDYAKYTVIPEIDEQVYRWADVLIIGLFFTQAAVGAYEVAWRVAGPALILTGAIGTTIFPVISSWAADESVESLEELLPKIITPSLIFVFPALFGGLLLSEEILGLIFGDEFITAWLALVILLVGKPPQAFRQIVSRSLLGLNRPDLVTYSASVDIITNLVLNSVFIWQFGILGAALGMALSMTIGMIHRTYYLSKIITIRIPYYDLGWSLLSSVGMFFILYLGKIAVDISTVGQLLGFVFAGAILYGVFILLYAPLKIQIVVQIRSVLERLV